MHLQVNMELKKYRFFILVVLVSTVSFSRVCGISFLSDMATGFAFDAYSTDLWSRANITMTAIQNLTVVPSNFSFVDLSSQINSTRSVVDVVNGFDPVQRFNSDFNSTLVRSAYVGNCSLKRVGDELLLFLNASSGNDAAIAAYNLSFTNSTLISKSDFVSFALSTTSTYDSSEAYIGVSLLLRDQQQNRYYVSVQISDQYFEDSFELNKWFLGWSFGEDYPRYSMTYNSTSGPWFIQLPLSDSFTSLNLSSAWLDGLLIGGEIFAKPPFDIEEITEVNARFRYILVHEQPFSINQELVNSTMMVFPHITSLRFSGIPSERVNVMLSGLLKPSYDREELRENETVNIRETFFNLSETFDSEILVHNEVEITTPSKAVKNFTLTLNNNTIIDLTDELLRYNKAIYRFPWGTTLVKIHITLYRFNAWIFQSMNPFGGAPYRISKKGIIEEYFSPNKNEGTININSSETSAGDLAIRSGNLTPSEITINGSKQLLESLLILNRETYWAFSIVVPEENASIYTVKYTLSDESLHQSFTIIPFSVYIDSDIFEIFSPFNIQGEEGTLTPLTVQIYTSRTYTLKIEYDPSMFEADRDEIMVYASRFHYEYFFLKPLRTGQTTINFKIMDPITEDTFFSFPFSLSIKSSFFTQVAFYFLLGVAVVSLIYTFSKKSLLKWIARFRH